MVGLAIPMMNFRVHWPVGLHSLVPHEAVGSSPYAARRLPSPVPTSSLARRAMAKRVDLFSILKACPGNATLFLHMNRTMCTGLSLEQVMERYAKKVQGYANPATFHRVGRGKKSYVAVMHYPAVVLKEVQVRMPSNPSQCVTMMVDNLMFETVVKRWLHPDGVITCWCLHTAHTFASTRSEVSRMSERVLNRLCDSMQCTSSAGASAIRSCG